MTFSLLATDGYKFSMAEAGWPLRRETFYYTHRKGGAQLLPFDVETEVRRLLPDASPEDYAYLAQHDYEMGADFKSAIILADPLRVNALPKGAWFFPKEPVFSVSGPSALVSWLEPLLLQLNFRIQVATLGFTNPQKLAHELAVVTCEEQRTIAVETLEGIGLRSPAIHVDSDGYYQRVKAQARELVEIVEDGGRLFEVGLRSATCLSQHRIALAACKDAGIVRTSSVLGARELGLTPVGTMGHEHIQRYGSDAAAFRAMHERRAQRSSYLLDTFDTLRSGIPAAYDLIAETPDRGDSIRYDSGDKAAQYLVAIERAKERGIRPVQIIEDSCDAAMTRKFEALRIQVGWRPDEQFYGYGGHLVASTMGGELTRDRVAAVYKLSQTDHTPTMKFGDEVSSGKQSLPGRPVLFRRTSADGPVGIVGQEGEDAPDGYLLLSGQTRDTHEPAIAPTVSGETHRLGYTRATQVMVDSLNCQRRSSWLK